jgi:hypothetical protein
MTGKSTALLCASLTIFSKNINFKLGLLGGIGRHNRLKICRSQGVPVRLWQQAPIIFIKNALVQRYLKNIFFLTSVFNYYHK